MLKRKSEFFDNNFQLINNPTKRYFYQYEVVFISHSKKDVQYYSLIVNVNLETLFTTIYQFDTGTKLLRFSCCVYAMAK